MTFKQIQDAVLADAFDESKRIDSKNWINHRYTLMCDLEEWTFMDATATVTFATGAQVVDALPTDFAAVESLWTSDGAPVRPIRDHGEFFSLYNQNLHASNGPPEAFTVVGSQLIVGPAGDGSTGLLIYQRAAPLLVSDSDVPIIPAGYHIALVQGGKAEGFHLTNILLADQFDVEFRGAIDAMRNKYLSPIRSHQTQAPAYPGR